MPPASDDPIAALLALFTVIPIGLWPGVGGLILVCGPQAYFGQLVSLLGPFIGQLVTAVAIGIGIVLTVIVMMIGVPILLIVVAVVVKYSLRRDEYFAD